ncbi:hypothetical protein [Candidatus Nitrosocosmicus sp. R]
MKQETTSLVPFQLEMVDLLKGHPSITQDSANYTGEVETNGSK